MYGLTDVPVAVLRAFLVEFVPPRERHVLREAHRAWVGLSGSAWCVVRPGNYGALAAARRRFRGSSLPFWGAGPGVGLSIEPTPNRRWHTAAAFVRLLVVACPSPFAVLLVAGSEDEAMRNAVSAAWRAGTVSHLTEHDTRLCDVRGLLRRYGGTVRATYYDELELNGAPVVSREREAIAALLPGGAALVGKPRDADVVPRTVGEVVCVSPEVTAAMMPRLHDLKCVRVLVVSWTTGLRAILADPTQLPLLGALTVNGLPLADGETDATQGKAFWHAVAPRRSRLSMGNTHTSVAWMPPAHIAVVELRADAVQVASSGFAWPDAIAVTLGASALRSMTMKDQADLVLRCAGLVPNAVSFAFVSAGPRALPAILAAMRGRPALRSVVIALPLPLRCDSIELLTADWFARRLRHEAPAVLGVPVVRPCVVYKPFGVSRLPTATAGAIMVLAAILERERARPRLDDL